MTIESHLELRQAIAIALEGELGTYTFANGLIAPAIAYVPNLDEHPPPGSSVSGLEVIILSATPSVAPLLQGYAIENKWLIYLKQWNPKQTPRSAFYKLLTTIKSIRRLIVVPADKKAGIPETYQLTLEDWDGVSWLT